LNNKQKTEISNLVISYREWILVDALIFVLRRFFEATKMISGRKYPTLSLAFAIKKMLLSFLNTIDESQDTSIYVYELKEAILPLFNYHFDQKISEKQKNATLVI
jgi:hypothetical protein